MKKIMLPILLLLASGCEQPAMETSGESATLSQLDADKTLVFFRTAGSLDEANDEWHLPVHGWVYKPEDSVFRKKSAAEVLEQAFDLVVTDETEANFDRRINLLIADNERGEKITIMLAGRNFDLPESAPNGHIRATVVLPAMLIAEHSIDGLISFTAVTDGERPRSFSGVIRLLDNDGLSIISDIDDTVKISEVGNHARLLERTFFLDFEAAPGMAATYAGWADADTGFHYVSSSPWQLYEPLREFLDQHEFPWASFSLKPLRFRDSTFFDLFKEGTETKPVAIRKILDQYPGRSFLLVGDSGEQDPEVYADLMRERPEQVLKIFIRNVTGESADNERFASVFEGLDPGRWQLFDDPKTLRLP